MANIESIKLPDGNVYDLKDAISGFQTAKTLRASDATTTSSANKLAALETAFSNLTDVEKRESYIKWGKMIFHCVNDTAGDFIGGGLDASGNIYLFIAQISTHKYVYAKMQTNGTLEYTDVSSSESQNAIYLYA